MGLPRCEKYPNKIQNIQQTFLLNLGSICKKTLYRWKSLVSYKNPYILQKLVYIFRDGSRAAAKPKIERSGIIVNDFQPLTIITKRSILDVSAALDPPLILILNSWSSFWGSLDGNWLQGSILWKSYQNPKNNDQLHHTLSSDHDTVIAKVPSSNYSLIKQNNGLC